MNLAWISNPMLVVLVALAAYRLTRLWVDDMLPPLPRVRAWVGKRASRWSLMYSTFNWDRRHPDSPRDSAERDRRIAADERRIDLYGGTPAMEYLINCYWCSGFWIGLALLLGCALLPTSVWILPVTALALSATTGLLSNTKH